MSMQTYIGTKVIGGIPMTRGEYNEYRGWDMPADKDGSEEGYLVEYHDSPNANHPKHENYISWSPKDVFDSAYRNIKNGMTFGDAIHFLKLGYKVARKGWNGKGMWIVMIHGTPNAVLAEGTPYRDALNQTSCEILPHIDMWTVNAEGRRAMLPGWLASQTDMLAEDWVIVD